MLFSLLAVVVTWQVYLMESWELQPCQQACVKNNWLELQYKWGL